MSDGWFANQRDMDMFQDFWEIRKTEARKTGISFYDSDRIKIKCRMVLFGVINQDDIYGSNCEELCGVRNAQCKTKYNDFCQVSKENDRRHLSPQWYSIWRKMYERMERDSIQITAIVGEFRFNAFKEFLSYKGKKSYDRFTRREINEDSMTEPKEFDAGFIGLDEIQIDPWELYKNNKLKKGELGCLQSLDSLFLPQAEQA